MAILFPRKMLQPATSRIEVNEAPHLRLPQPLSWMIHAFLAIAVAASFSISACAANAGGSENPTGAGAVATEELPEPGAPAVEPGVEPRAEPGTESTGGAEIPKEQRPVVILDAGHGGGDTGETGGNGTEEKEIVLQIARAAGELLADACKVVLTRREDVALSPEQRASDANYQRGNVFVSIHTGASGTPAANGIELFVPTSTITTAAGRTIAVSADDSSGELSRRLAQQLSSALQATTSASPRGIHSAPCRVFKGLTMPAVLIEVGFITNPVEEDLLAGEDYQRSIAEGIASGIRAFLSSTR